MAEFRVMFVQNRVCARTWRAAKVLSDAGNPPLLFELGQPAPNHDYRVFEQRIGVAVERDLRSMLLGRRRIVRALKAAVDVNQVEVVHTHNGPDNLGAWAVRHLDVPVVHDVHDLQSAAPIKFGKAYTRPVIHHLYKKWERAAVRGAQAVLVPSERMQDHLATRYGSVSVHVIENKALPTDVTHLPKRSAADGLIHVAYAGSFTLTSGSEREFLPGIERLSGGRIHTHIYPIIFDEAERERLKERVSDHPNVHYHDPVPHSRLVEELTQYDFGLVHFPVMTDNIRMASATKLYEYLLAGLPVIANPEGRIGKFVQEKGCGIVVDSLEEARPRLEAGPDGFHLPVDEAVLDADPFLDLYRAILDRAKVTASAG